MKYRQILEGILLWKCIGKGFYNENALDEDNSLNNVNSVHNISSKKYRQILESDFTMKMHWKGILQWKCIRWRQQSE